MKQPVPARSANYEMQLLRNMLKFAHCWTGDLAETRTVFSSR
jgi:hypothetical protein